MIAIIIDYLSDLHPNPDILPDISDIDGKKRVHNKVGVSEYSLFSIQVVIMIVSTTNIYTSSGQIYQRGVVVRGFHHLTVPRPGTSQKKNARQAFRNLL